MILNRTYVLAAISWLLLSASWLSAGVSYFYVGPFLGDFFDESNWNSMADGSGVAPAAGTIDPGVAIAEALVIDGDNVSANGTVELAGSLTVQPLSFLDINSGGGLEVLGSASFSLDSATVTVLGGGSSQIDFNSGSNASIINGSLTAEDDIFIRGTFSSVNATFESLMDDVEVWDGSSATITDSNFTVADSLILRASNSAITGSTFSVAGRIGIEGNDVTVVNTVLSAISDLEDVFTTGPVGGTLTLAGTSVFAADQVQEGVSLIIDDEAIASLTNVDAADQPTWITDGSLVTLNSTDATLVLTDPQSEDARMFIVNGLNGMTYADAPNTFLPSDWNGTDAVTLRIVPEPASALCVWLFGWITALALRRRGSVG